MGSWLGRVVGRGMAPVGPGRGPSGMGSRLAGPRGCAVEGEGVLGRARGWQGGPRLTAGLAKEGDRREVLVQEKKNYFPHS